METKGLQEWIVNKCERLQLISSLIFYLLFHQITGMGWTPSIQNIRDNMGNEG